MKYIYVDSVMEKRRHIQFGDIEQIRTPNNKIILALVDGSKIYL
jgi:hypothetical protein